MRRRKNFAAAIIKQLYSVNYVPFLKFLRSLNTSVS